ncbi:unnamed protein product [Schistosoma curassoni]|uniref:Very-long-chain 3-oxoacyl-CoA synthase n=1 Tax=Schistosoma curassoni TaxID=6186 RepID=A0A183JVE3_9TREM|nr:unnamed protein product [Schistosoma curassoni]
MSSAPICDRVNTYANKSRVIPGYEGIPYNLCVNVIGWVVLMCGFTLLRKLAWDYGRMATFQPRKNRFVQDGFHFILLLQLIKCPTSL